MNDVEALIAFSCTPGIGPSRLNQLLIHYGSLQGIVASSPEQWAHLAGFGPKIVENWKQVGACAPWKHEIKLAEKHGVQLIPYTSPLYPARLKELADFPLILYVKGSLLKEEEKSVAIVGTRQPTFYGSQMAHKFGEEMAAAGYSVISGLARGIDTAAHSGALKGGRTLAILGSGLNWIYPKENYRLAETIAENGALVSEYGMETPPTRAAFPRRNRMISGMSQATLLIEAPLKSGAVLTAELAKQQKRPLFVLPGRADQEHFRGNHLLIKKGAQLIENSAELIEALGGTVSSNKEKHAGSDRSGVSGDFGFSQEEGVVMKLLSKDELSLEQIALQTALPIQLLAGVLMGLVLKGRIEEYPGHLYKKNSSLNGV